MNEQEFQQRVVQALEPHSDALVSALRQLVTHTTINGKFDARHALQPIRKRNQRLSLPASRPHI